ncbi:MAG: GH3 auxin-responsive promoter family protein [Bacteroidia bacterium]|nr:GH3 auxin-responsive promoter family protein [Bacteroidia bacterium]
MSFLNSIASWWMRKRMHQIDLFMKYPIEVQEEWLQRLLRTARDTEWGKKHGYSSISNWKEYADRVPLQNYESMSEYIDRIRKGEQNLLWPEEITCFAKSSGTTNDKSKFIPVSPESLDGCHYNGGRDMVAIYCNNRPETQLFTGKNLALAGSKETFFHADHSSEHGDLSAIVISHLPLWAEFFRLPDLSVALMNNWDEKLEKLAAATMNENVVSLAGVPSWMLVLLKHILQKKNARSLREVWPSFEVYFHGGVSFLPYRKQFEELMGGKGDFMELYNASEGFFGIQDRSGSDELLLMLDYGIYYEFLPQDQWNKAGGKTIPLGETQTGVPYSMVITTTAGLWRYDLGDTIEFTSIRPYRFRITGRTKLFINAFGEELMIDNAERALAVACEKTGAVIGEFTAGPIFMTGSETGGHEWIIEFEKEPPSLPLFSELLDNALKSLNSDYEAKRFNDYTLQMPLIRSVKKGTFFDWMKSKNRLGGQNKVPRLANDRKFLDDILQNIHAW